MQLYPSLYGTVYTPHPKNKSVSIIVVIGKTSITEINLKFVCIRYQKIFIFANTQNVYIYTDTYSSYNL